MSEKHFSVKGGAFFAVGSRVCKEMFYNNWYYNNLVEAK